MITADDNIRSLDKLDRNCMFPEEISDLLIHKQYSYLNCKFECILLYAKTKVFEKHGTVCQPWFFPIANDSIQICNPWESYDFFSFFSDQVLDDMCPQCLPDCSTTFYEPSVTVQPFSQCDLRNIGVSRFCKISSKKPLPMTEKFATQIHKAYENGTAFGRFNYIPIFSSERYYYEDLFGFKQVSYDAFDNDIAMVQVIFQKSTAVLMGSQLAMTWIDYLATVGGLLGLVLGKEKP
jgi:hypothetical protein